MYVTQCQLPRGTAQTNDWGVAGKRGLLLIKNNYDP
jgi:hypothetical protein